MSIRLSQVAFDVSVLHPILRFSIRYNSRAATAVLSCFTVFWRKQSERGLALPSRNTLPKMASGSGRTKNPSPKNSSTASNRMKSAPLFPCLSCTTEVKSNDKGIQCDGCELWIHLSCSKLSLKSYEALKTDGDHLLFMCPPCQVTTKILAQKITCLQQDINPMKDAINQLQRQISEVQNQIKKLEEHRSEVPTYASALKSNLPANQIVNASTMVKIINTETKTMENRAGNVVVTGLNPDENVSEQLENLCTTLGVQVPDNSRQFWPKKKENRPHVLIWTTGVEKRKELLRKSKMLAQHEEWKNVYINRHMTKAEEEVDYHLRQELKKQRRAHPDKQFFIRMGEIRERKTNGQRVD